MSKIVRNREVCNLTGLSRSTIYELISNNQFPSQIRLGARSVGWRLVDVAAWIESRPTVKQNTAPNEVENAKS